MMEHIKEDDMVNRNKRVYVYFNFHKKCWSVRQEGKVVEHTNAVLLKDCRYLVGQAGRKRVLREKKKNVHAGVSGYMVDRVPALPEESKEITYNPYKFETFVTDSNEPVTHSDYAVLTCGRGWQDVEGMWE
jgi:hypothetical protein